MPDEGRPTREATTVLRELTEEQPENTTAEYASAVNEAVNHALEQAELGQLMSHEEVWLKLNKSLGLKSDED